MRARLSWILVIAALGVMIAACSVSGAEHGSAAAGYPDATRRSEPGSSVSLAPGETDFLASLNGSEKGTQPEKEVPVYVTALGFLLKLTLVLVLAYATILGLKKFTGMRGGPMAGRRRIRVVESSSLGASKSLHLVEIGPKRLLLASTPNQVNLISELCPEDLPEQVAADEPPVGGFREQLAMFLGSRADSLATEHRVADMLRESSRFIQSKIGEVRGTRKGEGDQSE